jgi:hypothetical protein
MASGFLSYQDTRGEVDWLGKVIDRVNDYLENREKKEKVADMVAAKVNILNDQKTLPGSSLQKMLRGSSLQRSLPGGPMAINPDVIDSDTSKIFPKKRLTSEGFVGNSIVDISSTSLGVERDSSNSDMFVKRLNAVDDGMGGGSGEVVQAIDRLTFVTMSLVAATKEQTQQQKLIASTQQQQAEKLARQAKAASEESALEMGADLSGNTPYQRLLSGATNAMGGSRGGGGPGMGIGGKAMTKALLGSATKRGAARTGTRLGAALGGKMMGGLGKRVGAKLGAKSAGKIAGGAIAKSLGKKIPLVGLGLGAVFAAQRAMQGDFLGAGLELASGAASTVPGIGTAGSVGIDAALAARDMTMMADGGIVDSPTNAIIGEKGREGVFPLEGSKGKKTFLQFGEGILEAQKKNKREFAKIQALGLSEYYDKQNGWEKFVGWLKNIFPWANPDKDSNSNNKFNLFNPSTWFNNSNSKTPTDNVSSSPMVGSGPGGSGQDFLTLATIASLESGSAQGQADVAQSVYNRLGDTGQRYGKSITEILTRQGQYQVAFKDPTVIRGPGTEVADVFKNIKSEDDAVKAIQYYYEAKGQSISEDAARNRFRSASKAISDPELRKLSAEFVGGRTEFLSSGSEVSGPDVVWRGSGLDNKFYVEYGSGTQLQRGAQSSPKGLFNISKPAFSGLSPTADDMNWYNKQIQESQSFLPSSVETESISPSGDTSSIATALNAKSTEFAMASSVGGAGTTIINNITNMNGGSSNGGNAPTNVPFGIALIETGTSSFSNMDLRTIG